MILKEKPEMVVRRSELISGIRKGQVRDYTYTLGLNRLMAFRRTGYYHRIYATPELQIQTQGNARLRGFERISK